MIVPVQPFGQQRVPGGGHRTGQCNRNDPIVEEPEPHREPLDIRHADGAAVDRNWRRLERDIGRGLRPRRHEHRRRGRHEAADRREIDRLGYVVEIEGGDRPRRRGHPSMLLACPEQVEGRRRSGGGDERLPIGAVQRIERVRPSPLESVGTRGPRTGGARFPAHHPRNHVGPGIRIRLSGRQCPLTRRSCSRSDRRRRSPPPAGRWPAPPARHCPPSRCGSERRTRPPMQIPPPRPAATAAR